MRAGIGGRVTSESPAGSGRNTRRNRGSFGPRKGQGAPNRLEFKAPRAFESSLLDQVLVLFGLLGVAAHLQPNVRSSPPYWSATELPGTALAAPDVAFSA